MEWWQMLLGMLFLASLVFVFVYEVFISTLIDNYKYNKRKKKWDQLNYRLGRIKCKDCKYCKSSTQYFGNLPQRVPEYCSLLKRKVHKNSSCLIPEPPLEFCTTTNRKNIDTVEANVVYFSKYGKYYHSSTTCPSIQNPESQYSSPVGGLGRLPCKTCWEERNGVLYPKY